MVTWRYKIPLLVLKNISNTRKEISYIIYSIYLMLPNLISSYPTYFFLSHLILTYYQLRTCRKSSFISWTIRWESCKLKETNSFVSST